MLFSLFISGGKREEAREMISTIGRLSKEEADLLLQENARRWSHL
jgi:hypothetical protein